MSCYKFNGHLITIRYAVDSDAEHIFNMYNRIAITEKNIGSSLIEGKFSKRGGMFETSTLDDIYTRIADENEKVIVGEIDGSPVAMLWYGIADGSVFGSVIADCGFEDTVDNINILLKKGKLGCVKEIVALKSEISHIMPFLLNLEAARDLINDGLSQMVCEAFCVNGFDYNGNHYNCNLLNKASVNTIMENGGLLIGKSPEKKVVLSDYNAYITPYIYLWDLNETVNIAVKIITEKGVTENEK